MRRFLTAAVLVFSALTLRAQDPNFSQFFSSPLTLNPALTGKFDGDLRFAMNYRNQWPTIYNAYVTGTGSLDIAMLRQSLPEYDQMGIGFMGFSDKTAGGALSNNYAAVSLAYHKALDEDGYSQLGLGFQGVYTSKRLDVSRLTFMDQLTANGFTNVTQEVFEQQGLAVSYLDVNAGVLYSGSTNGINSFYLGASMYHLNRPRESFLGGQYYLQPRLTVQAGGMLPQGEYNAVHFSANHSRQAGAANTMLGGAYMLNLNPDDWAPTNLYLGSWVRLGDAVIPYVGLEFSSFHFGLTYDVNTSSLKPASNTRGGAELTLIYTKRPSDPNRKKLNCPRF